MDQSRTFAQSVQALLAADILTGKIAPGTRLRLQALCDAYQVSMSPLREALAGLTGRGLVIQEGQRGFCVAPASADDLRDVTQTRVQLETLALKFAMERGGTEWEGAILAAHHRLTKNPRRAEQLIDETWENLHRGYHLALIAACGQPRLLGFCMALYDHFDRYRRIAVLASRRHPTLKSKHLDIVDAVLSKKVARAQELLGAHIEESTAQMVNMLGQKGLAKLSAVSD